MEANRIQNKIHDKYQQLAFVIGLVVCILIVCIALRTRARHDLKQQESKKMLPEMTIPARNRGHTPQAASADGMSGMQMVPQEMPASRSQVRQTGGQQNPAPSYPLNLI